MSKKHCSPHEDVLDLVGWKSLVCLKLVAKGVLIPVYEKCEFMNPGGSVKDRIGPAIIEDDEARKNFGWGGAIVETASGNIGMVLATVSMGYDRIFTMLDKMKQEKVRLLRAFGAEVVIRPTAVPPDHREHSSEKAKRISRETSGTVLAGQYGEIIGIVTRYDLVRALTCVA